MQKTISYFALIFALISGTSLSNTNIKIVAAVNATLITDNMLLARVNEKLPLISIHRSVSEKRFKEIRHEVLNQMIEEELLYQEAKRKNLNIDKNVLRKQINMMKQAYPSEKVFKRELEKTATSYEQWVNKIKRRLLQKELVKQEVADKITFTDKDVFSYYEKNKFKFKIPEQMRLLHILISVSPGGMRKGWQSGLEKAQGIYKRIIDGEDFSSIAKEVSDDTTSSVKGGDIGWLHVGQLLPEIDEVAAKLKIGEVSQPIRTIYGYHLIKLIDRKDAKQLKFSEVDKKNLKKRIYQKRLKEQEKKYLEQLKRKANIRIFEQ